MAVRLPATKTKDILMDIKDFSGGTNTLISERRLNKKFATESNNIIQCDDGVWKTRPGTNYYGLAITGISDIDGAAEYIKTDDTRELIAVGGGKVWKSTDGGAWSEVTGATPTAGLKPFFLQIGSKLYITNGTDDLCYYDGTDLTKYSAITKPNAPTASLTGLTTGTFKNYYRIVAVNDVGFTEPSNSLEQTTNEQRDIWSGTDKVSLSWGAVAGANAYQIYWGDIDGEELLIGTTTNTAFDDDGSFEPNPYVETPDDNTTAAPKFRAMEISGNRIWATYDPNNKWRVYYSGTGQYLGYYSPFYGGGYIDLEKGSRNEPVSVVHYRTGKGDPMITVLCSSPDGLGTIFQIDLTSATIGDTTFTVPAAYKIVGSIGANAPYCVVKAGDNVFFVNVKGAFTLRNKAQMFNVLATDDLSAPIRNEFLELNTQKISDACGYYRPPVVYFSLPKGSTNDRVAIFDLERSNWSWSWNIGFNQFLEYTDNSGYTHFLGVPTSGNRMLEISESFTTDLGQAFNQSYISTLIPVSDDDTDQAKIKEAIFSMGDFYGSVTCEVLGIDKDQAIEVLGTTTKESANTLSTNGWGADLFDAFLFSSSSGIPTTTTQPVTKVVVNVNKKIYAIQFHVFSNTAGSGFKLLGIQAKGTLIPSRSPSTWRE